MEKGENKINLIKDISENIKYLLSIIVVGLWWGFISVVALAMLLESTLEIDIFEFDKSYRLLLLAWGVCTIGTHLYFKNEEEKEIQEQLNKLRHNKTVYYPHSKLMERWEKEKQFKKWEQEYLKVDLQSNDPFSPVPNDPANPRRQLLTEWQKEISSSQKNLIASIPTKGKTSKQIAKEGLVAFQKYEQVKKQVKDSEIAFIAKPSSDTKSNQQKHD